MPKQFTKKRRVQFAETDLAGIMHFANFFRVMEEVEHAYFRSLGFSVAMPVEGGELGFPRVATRCEYFTPVRFEEVMECRLEVLRIGNKSLTHEVTFVVAAAGDNPERRVARGETTVVCVLRQPGGFESIPIPEFIRSGIEA